jgi:hypothetical protein
MGGLIEEHAGCHVATSVLAAGRRARVRWIAPCIEEAPRCRVEARRAFVRPERKGFPRCARRFAALTPGSLRLESDQEGRWPSSLTRPSAQLGIRDAPPGHAFRGETLQRCRAWTRRSRTRIHGIQVDQVDQYPAALRDLIMPPCGSRSRREVDLP